MKERQILFNSPMVRAILEGRKTQTRRVCRLQPREAAGMVWWPDGDGTDTGTLGGAPGIYLKKCPYGELGDRLWVREAWQGPLLDSEEDEERFRFDGPEAFKNPRFCAYRATDTIDAVNDDGNELGWRPSIHMPRWASRITLEVTGVRVERLRDISEADAIAEGCDNSKSDAAIEAGWYEKPRAAYRRLWEQINGAGSWEANPWVWVIEFEVVK